MTNPFDPGFYGSEELTGFGFGSVGSNVFVSRDCKIFGNLDNIAIGNNTRIDSGTTIVATGKVDIGSFVHIGGGCHIVAKAGFSMGDYSGFSQGVKAYTCSDDYSGTWLTNPTVDEEFTGCTSRPIHVGRHAIIGAGAVILPGADIGDGAAIGALSLVTRRQPDFAVCSGVPARFIKHRRKDHLLLEDLHQAKVRLAVHQSCHG